MPEPEVLTTLRAELRRELTGRLLPYWVEHAIDAEHGGFVGQIAQDGRVVPEAPKGVVLNARILWTFSAAYRVLGDEAYCRVAERARDYLAAHFWDPKHEGVYWSVDYRGRPHNTRKQVYGQAFALYALAECHRATQDPASLERAVRLFRLIEQHAYDIEHGGYFEAYRDDWGPLADVRLSEKDLNAPKSMNTLLHVLEAYTNLYRAWPDALLRDRLAALTDRFLTTVIDTDTWHLRLFFETDWTPVSDVVSFGHDIEASWLLLEAADVLGDAALRERAAEAAVMLARTTLEEGRDEDGGLFNEAHPDGTLDTDKHWWPQAEAIVGFLNAHRETNDVAFLDAAVAAWAFTKRHMLDGANGEWFARVDRNGVPYEGEDKVGPWKCPYHNGRACLEVIERTEHTAPPAAKR